MILSHRHRFIFIKTAKTAGTSIEVLLSQHCGADDVLTPIYPPVEPHVARNDRGVFNPLPEILRGDTKGIRQSLIDVYRHRKYFNHMPARLIRARVSARVWKRYFTFCVERNPWDKTLSHYHMMKHRAGGVLSLDDYFRAGRYCLNYPRYTDQSGRIIVDRVVKYEHLEDELQAVFEMLGIPFDGSLGVHAKAEFRQDRRPYREVFTPAQRAIIKQAFAKEIELHGYTFE